MKKFFLGGIAAAAIACTGAAIAQTAPVAPVQQPTRVAKTQSRADVQAHVARMFERVDTNKDGVITKQEADAVQAQFVARAKKHMGERGAKSFERLDTNKDGQVSRQEFDAGRVAREQRQALRKPGEPLGGNVYLHRKGGMGFAGRMFEMADVNKDGRVSLPEAQQAALQHFDRADLNRDGTLTPEERRQSRQQMKAQKSG